MLEDSSLEHCSARTRAAECIELRFIRLSEEFIYRIRLQRLRFRALVAWGLLRSTDSSLSLWPGWKTEP